MAALAPRSRARALPRSKAAQLSAGVTAQARESPLPKRLPRPASRPRQPESVTRGYSSAAATPSRAGGSGQPAFGRAHVRPAAAGTTTCRRAAAPWPAADRPAATGRPPSVARPRRRPAPPAGARARASAAAHRRQPGVDGRHPRGGAGHVLLLAEAGVAPHLGEPQRLALVGQAALEHRQLLLQAAQLEVVARHLGRHDHAHVLERRVEALGVGLCGADRRSRPGRRGRSPRTRRTRPGTSSRRIGSSVKPGTACSRTSTVAPTVTVG